MANFLLPFFGESTLAAIVLVNGVESVIRQIAGNDEGSEAAKERMADAAREYLEKNLIAGSLNYATRRFIVGDRDGARAVANNLTESVATTMGFLQPLPVVGEAATVLAAGAHYANGDNEAAQDFLFEYTERSLIGGSINSAKTAIQGDQTEARRIASRMGTSTLGVVQSVGGMAARIPTGGLPNPLSKALENSGEVFIEEGAHRNPDWTHTGKEAFAKGANGFVTGTYILAAAGPATEDAVRRNLYGEEVEAATQDRAENNVRAFAIDAICGVTEHKIIHKVTHRWDKHKQPQHPIAPGKPPMNMQPPLANSIPVVSTTNMSVTTSDEESTKNREKYGHGL